MSKKGKSDITLSNEEVDEFQMILDRLAVQDPDGESLERYLTSLRTTLASRPLLAAALVDKLSKNPNRTGFLTFQALETIVDASPYRRHLKQAAYRFTQKGFAKFEKDAAPREKVVLIQGDTRKVSAHLLLVQGTLWLISAHIPDPAQGAYCLVTAFMEDDYQTFNVRIVEQSTQKLYRDYLQKIAGHASSGRSLEIPIHHAARLFFDSFLLWTGRNSYAQLEKARGLFSKYYEPQKKPYAYELMPEIEHPERHFSEVDLAGLLREMDISWLKIPMDNLGPWREKAKAILSPLLVVPPEVQAERTAELLRSAANELCSGGFRTLYTRFFEEQAMAFKLSGEEDNARQAWIVAQHLAGEGPAGDNPVVPQIVALCLEAYWPDDFREQPAPTQELERERRTESGLILP